jgi:2-keto-3-deoxy-L-rhamnonate aldolase RhmA
MDEEALNISIRKFLKMVGVNSQREIEHAVATAVASGKAAGISAYPAQVTLKVAGLGLEVAFDGEIRLQ